MSVFVRLFLGVCCFLILDSFRLEGQIDSFYTVLVGEYMKPQPKDFQSLRNLGFLLKDGSDNKKRFASEFTPILRKQKLFSTKSKRRVTRLRSPNPLI
ncbi:MAG: hypothetical protein R2784_13340 [Saprospiraceae bacterium]